VYCMAGSEFLCVSDFVGVESPEFISDVIFTNSIHGEGLIEFSFTRNSILNISIFDLSGKMILNEMKQFDVGANSYPFDISQFLNGVYILQLQNGTNTFGKKMMIIQQ